MGAEVVVAARALGAKLQLKVEAVRGSPANARFVQDRLRAIPGVVEVTANPLTGSVQVVYDPRPIRSHGVVETSRALTVVPRRELVVAGPGSSSSSLLMRLAKFVTVVAFEVVLQRVLGPLFLPRRC